MQCPHCCNYVREEDEIDMPFSLFKKALDIWGRHFNERDHRIIIGGGEPTVHPDFWNISANRNLQP